MHNKTLDLAYSKVQGLFAVMIKLYTETYHIIVYLTESVI